MLLPVAIHKDADSVFGVTVPDVAGCFSSGNTIKEAIQNAQEAVKAHVEILLEMGNEPVITPSTVEALRGDDDYKGAMWAFIDVDLKSARHA